MKRNRKKILYFLKTGVWLEEQPVQRSSYRLLLTLLRKLYIALKLFIERGHSDYAAQLSFSTILAIVPIFALILAIGRGFGLANYIENSVKDWLNSQPEVANFIIHFSNAYLEHARTGLFIGIGILFMLGSIISLIYNIEQVFDSIWQVKSKRSLRRIVSDYLSMIFVVPIIIIVLSGLSIIANTTNAELQQFIFLGPISQVLVQFLPFFAQMMIFLGLFIVMPNTHVKVVHALFPAALASLLMLILQWAYVHSQIFLTSYNAIYGSLAALPLFMLWMHLSWYILLFCTELCYMSQNLDNYDYMIKPSEISEYTRRHIALLVITQIINRFKTGEKAPSPVELKQQTHIPIRLINDALYRLQGAQLIVEANLLDDNEQRFLPAQALKRLPIGQIIEQLDTACADKRKDKRMQVLATLDPQTEAMLHEVRQEALQKLNQSHDF